MAHVQEVMLGTMTTLIPQTPLNFRGCFLLVFLVGFFLFVVVVLCLFGFLFFFGWFWFCGFFVVIGFGFF